MSAARPGRNGATGERERRPLVLKGLGSVRTRTMKAFPEAAYRGIMASLG